jgi:hypothetical protein
MTGIKESRIRNCYISVDTAMGKQTPVKTREHLTLCLIKQNIKQTKKEGKMKLKKKLPKKDTMVNSPHKLRLFQFCDSFEL